MLRGRAVCFTRPGRVISESRIGIAPDDFSEQIVVTGDDVAVRIPTDGLVSTPGYVLTGTLEEMLAWVVETEKLLRGVQAAREERAAQQQQQATNPA